MKMAVKNFAESIRKSLQFSLGKVENSILTWRNLDGCYRAT